MGADYLILQSKDELETFIIWEIIDNAPKLLRKEFLKKLNYLTALSCENYLMFKLKPVGQIFWRKKWNLKKLRGPGSSSFKTLLYNTDINYGIFCLRRIFHSII